MSASPHEAGNLTAEPMLGDAAALPTDAKQGALTQPPTGTVRGPQNGTHDVTTLLAPVKARAEAATAGPWSDLDAQIRHTQIDGWVDPKGRAAAQKQTAADIDFVKNARTDVPRLIQALEAVEDLASVWNAKGEHDMAYSKTIPDEDIAMELLTHGADMVEKARIIRTAVVAALGDE